MFDDKEWLGDEAYLAPFARAGVGILLARGVYFVPTKSYELHHALERAIPSHGVARWDHASEVLDADKWLEPKLAIEIAEALSAIMRERGLRIRVAKSVWKQQSATLEAIIADLGRAAGPERVFAEWPGRANVPRPGVERGESRSPVVDRSKAFRDERSLVVDALPRGSWQTDAFATDLYITTSSDTPRTRVPTVVAIVVGAESGNVIDGFISSREQHRARCLVHVPIQHEASGPWFEAFFSAWKEPSTPIDDALKAANDGTGIAARIVAATQAFILESSWFLAPEGAPLHDLVDFSEHAFSQPAPEAMQGHSADEPRLAALLTEPQPRARVLDARVMSGSRLIRRLPSSGSINIFVNIRPKTELDGERQIFPDDEVRWNGDSKTFQIHMLELGSDPVTREIEVPRFGQSEPARFNYELRNQRTDLRFIVSDGARILQTARLLGAPNEWVRFNVESIAAPIAPQQKQFDVALLVNDSLGGAPSLTSLTYSGIELSPLTDTEADRARTEMLEILERAVVDPEAPTAKVLLHLANRGKGLLRYLRTRVRGWPARIDRVQLTSQSDAFFPLEYLYDGPLPPNAKHGICSESRTCLARGEAVPDCPIRSAATQFCPMGFLGLTAVIERQTWRPGSAPGIWLALPKEIEERDCVTNVSPMLFCASDQADNFDDVPEASERKHVRTSEIVEALGCSRPNSWAEWKERVRSDNPSMLVLVVHIEDDELHLGTDDSLIIGAISQDHIGAARPIAIAIGCSSGYGRMVGASLPAALMAEGARVVIAAMTDVLGRHANKAALELALALRTAVSSTSTGGVSIGELMTRLRRSLLAADIALGLALVAYGDADIALGPEQR